MPARSRITFASHGRNGRLASGGDPRLLDEVVGDRKAVA